MNIAILKSDSVSLDLQGRFFDYEKMVTSWIKPIMDKSTAITVYDMVSGDKPLYTHELYISTGSKKSVYELESWIKHYEEVVQELHVKKHCHFGICFGHQMIAQALGGKVVKSPKGWGIGIHTWQITEIPSCIKTDIEIDSLSLAVSHQDQVVETTADMKTFLSSPFCNVAGFTVGKHIMTVQGHPEFPVGYVEAIMDKRKSLYTIQEYNMGKASLDIRTDENILLDWIKQFFLV